MLRKDSQPELPDAERPNRAQDPVADPALGGGRRTAQLLRDSCAATAPMRMIALASLLPAVVRGDRRERRSETAHPDSPGLIPPAVRRSLPSAPVPDRLASPKRSETVPRGTRGQARHRKGQHDDRA
jgi:hypothetical protein